MTDYFVSTGLLSHALESLHAWYLRVPTQKSRHVWSVLPPKVAGAQAGNSIAYAEADDKRFMERFLRAREGSYPYFDPFSHDWLPEGYAHSNMSTMRKNTFVNRWGTALWHDDTLSLTTSYANDFVERALTKAGQVTRIPALSCAVWFYKRPAMEWGSDHPFSAGLPLDPDELLMHFRSDFHFDDDHEWAAIFDESRNADAVVRGMWGHDA